MGLPGELLFAWQRAWGLPQAWVSIIGPGTALKTVSWPFENMFTPSPTFRDSLPRVQRAAELYKDKTIKLFLNYLNLQNK